MTAARGLVLAALGLVLAAAPAWAQVEAPAARPLEARYLDALAGTGAATGVAIGAGAAIGSLVGLGAGCAFQDEAGCVAGAIGGVLAGASLGWIAGPGVGVSLGAGLDFPEGLAAWALGYGAHLALVGATSAATWAPFLAPTDGGALAGLGGRFRPDQRSGIAARARRVRPP